MKLEINFIQTELLDIEFIQTTPINITFIQPIPLCIDFDQPGKFGLKFGEIQQINTPVGELPIYDGEYVIVPSVKTDRDLPTAHKFLTRDVVLKKVPYYEVDNTSGGTTIYIGSDEELEFG